MARCNRKLEDSTSANQRSQREAELHAGQLPGDASRRQSQPNQCGRRADKNCEHKQQCNDNRNETHTENELAPMYWSTESHMYRNSQVEGSVTDKHTP